jgi:hypothetical protein
MTNEIVKVADNLVSGLKGSPALLALIALNIIMVGAAVWFLKALAAAQASRFDVLLKACVGKTP